MGSLHCHLTASAVLGDPLAIAAGQCVHSRIWSTFKALHPDPTRDLPELLATRMGRNGFDLRGGGSPYGEGGRDGNMNNGSEVHAKTVHPLPEPSRR